MPPFFLSLYHIDLFSDFASQDLAKKYSDRLECCENEVEKIIEEIRCKAIKRGTGNENYKTTGIATIEVFLPPRLRKVSNFPKQVHVAMLC